MPDEPPAKPFPPAAYVFGWLVICLVVAEGIDDIVRGVLGTGILLLCLIPVMVWLMHIRPRRASAGRRRG